MAIDIKDITDAYDYDRNGWQDIRREAAKDMRYVAGDPWDPEDKTARNGRPTVAPDELSQYRNQVVNGLMSNPRGMKFSPTGNGANDEGAKFYQNKAREIEYRSHGAQQYLLAADNALQRGYGFVRVTTRYASPRSANQDLWIEGFANPDMVMPDCDALMPDSSDMKRCWVYKWVPQGQFKTDWPKAKIVNFSDWQSSYPSFIQGKQVLVAEFWKEQTRKRKLLLVKPPDALIQSGRIAPELQLFEDEITDLPEATVLRELREVDDPEIWLYLTNGLEILHEQKWLGKYIPIISCYGKVLYVPEGDTPQSGRGTNTVKGRVILSMTRFGRDPWKAYCYACSQELEVLGQVPKAPVIAYEGQLAGHETEWQESLQQPKAFLYAKASVEGVPSQQTLPLPTRNSYIQGEYLQSIEIVKEGWRRAIQAAMGSNFLPTEAQKINDKSGVALDKINQAATVGTYHFVFAYESMIRRVGMVVEDLVDKIYDYRGETGVMLPDGKAQSIAINDPNNQEAISTKGDYLVTVSTAPSSDSEETAVEEFTDTLVAQIERIAQLTGPKPAAALLAKSIRMRRLGPQGDQLADLIEPQEYKTEDGKPPNTQMLAMQGELTQLKQLLQRAATEKQAKVVELQGKYAIEQMKEQAETDRSSADREVKLAIAELGARVDRLALFLEESRLVGARAHEHVQSAHERVHDDIQRTKDRAHDRVMADVAHTQALEQADQGVAGQMAVQAAAPQPEAAV